jgi:hypothetical protein
MDEKHKVPICLIFFTSINHVMIWIVALQKFIITSPLWIKGDDNDGHVHYKWIGGPREVVMLECDFF